MAQRIASLYAEIGADTQGLKRGLDQTKGQLREAGSRMENFRSAALKAGLVLGGVGIAAKQAYQAIGEGADLQLARSQFDNLAASIGTTSDVILGRLREASGGMMSNAEMIEGASQIISLGLANNQEDVVKLANLVSRLGLDMQQVILTFANNSKARLDALGLSVEAVTKRAAELEAQGFVGDAFDQAVIEGLTDRMNLLGDASETTAGELKVLESNWKDLTDTAKTWLAQAANPVIANLNDLVKNSRDLNYYVERGAITSWQKFIIQLAATTGRTQELVYMMNLYGDELRAVDDEQRRTELHMRAYGEGTRNYGNIVLGASRANEELADKLFQAGNQLDFAAVRALKYEQRMGGLAQETGVAADEVFTLNDYLMRLPSELDVSVNLRTMGINTLERANALLNSIRGMTPDPYGGFTPGESAPSPGDAFDPGMGGGPPPGEGGIPTPAPNQGPPSNVAPMNVNITMIGSKATPQQVATEVSRVLTVRG